MSLYESLRSILCKLGKHDFEEEQRHTIASSNVGEIRKTCQRCGKTIQTYQPR